MGELKPCPFCGGEAISFSDDNGWNWRGENEYRAYAGCHSEGCGIGFELFHTGDDLFDENVDDTPDGITCKALELQAIEAWNTRPERTCHPVDAFDKKTRLIVERGQTHYYWPYSGCSECGCDFPQGSNYCPNCGAKVVE